jgi:AraC family transcriptional regulator of adaptative response / DNA-3-methyladenine glycosylase II
VLDPRVCYRALETRDERFDGRLFVGVTSTGIYCRPVCPAGPAKPENCVFFPTAAAAQESGFRPCLRCRPETAPDLGTWRGTSNTVSRGLALIADGGLDGDTSVERLAERLGIGQRQLRRLFREHLGASPVAVAQTRRVLFAKQLIHETQMPMAEIALASGFGSVRRFNETFQRLFRRPPSTLRRAARERAPDRAAAGVVVRMRYRPPYDWRAMLAHLAARAIDGVEAVHDDVYRRTISIEGQEGTIEVAHVEDARSLAAAIRFPRVEALAGIVERIRRVFDVNADVETIGAHLSRDRSLARLVARRPGLRSPGGWDGFELAVRAVLGQQVTVEAARLLAGRLATICGTPLRSVRRGSALTRAFPSAEQIAQADLSPLGTPNGKKRTLRAVAEAALRDPSLFLARDSLEETVARLRAIHGVGDWTAHYIALRAAREPDAFPASDVGLLRAVSGQGPRISPGELEARAERWRPWRGYAAQHLWAADAEARQGR